MRLHAPRTLMLNIRTHVTHSHTRSCTEAALEGADPISTAITPTRARSGKLETVIRLLALLSRLAMTPWYQRSKEPTTSPSLGRPSDGDVVGNHGPFGSAAPPAHGTECARRPRYAEKYARRQERTARNDVDM